MTDKTQKIVEAFDERYENLGPFDDNWQELCIAASLRELIRQYSYNNYYVDGDHGIGVVNVKDILKLIGDLEK